jgi:hypothetical protein
VVEVYERQKQEAAMSNNRSPQYPIIGLKEAIEKARLVWQRDYTNELPRDVIASHMGYSGLNGKSLGLLSTVGKFGLLEGRGDKTRVTDLAVQIFAHEAGTPERIAAIRTAAEEPALFKEIATKFAGRSPSDQALKAFLVTRGFTHGGVDAVIRSFRDTEGFVQSEVGSYDGAMASTEPENAVQAIAGESVVAAPPRSSTGVPTISMSDRGLEISGGVISTMEQFEKLMRRLAAGKMLLDDGDV